MSTIDLTIQLTEVQSLFLNSTCDELSSYRCDEGLFAFIYLKDSFYDSMFGVELDFHNLDDKWGYFITNCYDREEIESLVSVFPELKEEIITSIETAIEECEEVSESYINGSFR